MMTMADTTTIRISRAICALRQDDMARTLTRELTLEEKAWLDADAG